jgi:1-acyl-sn-glycerol-3-phosphate acyltransferase
LPRRGPVLLVSNHTSPADPLLLQCATRRLISFLMAREYFSIPFLGWVFQLSKTIPVNRTGRDIAAFKAAIRALEEGRVIGVFPEGGINLDPNTLREGKPGAAMFALMTRVPVIPAFIERRKHTNGLIDGLLWPAEARIFFGHRIELRPYYGRRHDREVLPEVTELMMRSIEQLRPKSAKSEGEWSVAKCQ